MMTGRSRGSTKCQTTGSIPASVRNICYALFGPDIAQVDEPPEPQAGRRHGSVQVNSATCLRHRDAMPGTHVAYGATSESIGDPNRHVRVYIHTTFKVRRVACGCVCGAMSGSDISSGGTRSLSKSEETLLGMCFLR